VLGIACNWPRTGSANLPQHSCVLKAIQTRKMDRRRFECLVEVQTVIWKAAKEVGAKASGCKTRVLLDGIRTLADRS
jgi:hypothetical protein